MSRFKIEYTLMQLHFKFLELGSGVLHLIQINSTNNLGKCVFHILFPSHSAVNATSHPWDSIQTLFKYQV